MLCYFLTVYAKFLGVHCNEMAAVSSWIELYIKMLLQTRRLSFLEGVDFMNCDLTSNPPTAFKKNKKFNKYNQRCLKNLLPGNEMVTGHGTPPQGFVQ